MPLGDEAPAAQKKPALQAVCCVDDAPAGQKYPAAHGCWLALDARPVALHAYPASHAVCCADDEPCEQ